MPDHTHTHTHTIINSKHVMDLHRNHTQHQYVYDSTSHLNRPSFDHTLPFLNQSVMISLSLAYKRYKYVHACKDRRGANVAKLDVMKSNAMTMGIYNFMRNRK